LKALLALAFALAGIHVGDEQVSRLGTSPAWSSNGERLTFVVRGDVWIADADGTHAARLVARADSPAWAPDGRALAFTRDGAVWTVRADGVGEQRVARGAHPAWKPDGARIAFDRDGTIYSVLRSGGNVRAIGEGVDPAFAPDGRLAVSLGGAIHVGGRYVADGYAPAWSPDGRRLAYVRDDTIYVDEGAVTPGHQPAWRPSVPSRELLPDFEMRAPTDLTLAHARGRWFVGFTSSVDNIGLGPAEIVGTRAAQAARMRAVQRVQLGGGGSRTYADAGVLRYTKSPPHFHWHLMKFVSFELRSLDGRVLVSDRKQGFCLADHYGTAPGSFVRHAAYLGRCARGRPSSTYVLQGTSVGFTDRYPAFFHGQNVEITQVAPGDYVLVHRANPNLYLRELRYENDAASVRVRIGRRGGSPTVAVLRRCESSAQC